MRKRKTLITVIALSMFLVSLAGTAFATPVQEVVEGQGDYFVTGESYPTAIQIAGYNSNSKNLYLNFTLKTTKTVADTQTATFEYKIDVFDGAGRELATITGSQAGAAGATSATITNKEITLTSPLTAAYRVVITVTSVTVN